jgi:hypothetical protein
VFLYYVVEILMAGNKSGVKGGTGEREACKILGEIFEGSFIRSPSSGAFIGGKNVYRKKTLSAAQTQSRKGDVIPPDNMQKMVLECKNYAKFLFHQLLMNGTCSQLDEWIKQTIDILDDGDVWFVIFKISRIGWFVAVPDGCSDYVFGNHCVYSGKHGKFLVTDMKAFFESNKDIVLKQTA